MRKRSGTSANENKPATLVDVAREAGVGTTTVSRVLNGAQYVHADTLARIQAAMGKLAYSPSHAARALKGESTRSLGLIVPSLRDEFFAALAHDIQVNARARGYVVLVLASEDDASRQIEEIEILRSHRVNGAILAPPRTQSRAFLQALRLLRAPIVAIDRPLTKNIPFIGVDNFSGALQATQQLLKLGRKRILFAGGDPDLYTIRERYRGYEAAMVKAGLQPLAFSSAADPAATAELERQLRQPARLRPDAILGALNAATLAAFAALQKLQVRIPDEIALIGFDDFTASALLQPSISVVRQPVEEIGRTAFHALMALMQDGPAIQSKTVLAPEMILRGSSGS